MATLSPLSACYRKYTCSPTKGGGRLAKSIKCQEYMCPPPLRGGRLKVWRSCRGAGGCRGNPGILGLEQQKHVVCQKVSKRMENNVSFFFLFLVIFDIKKLSRRCRGDVAEPVWGCRGAPKVVAEGWLGFITFGRKRVMSVNSVDVARLC